MLFELNIFYRVFKNSSQYRRTILNVSVCVGVYISSCVIHFRNYWYNDFHIFNFETSLETNIFIRV